jgi:putative Holliday junction resolvase
MSTNIIDLDTLAGRLRRYDRLLGIDLGTKTIGLAVSDVERHLSTPVTTIRRTKFTQDAAQLVDHAKRLDVAALVIGLPLNMDGSEGPRVQATKAFIRSMSGLTPLPFVFWDERLSTAAVTRTLIEQDASRKKRAEVVDRMAAAYILQGALDRLARLGPIDA